MPLPMVPGSKRFLDKEVIAIVYVMVIVARPNGQNITDNGPDSFGRTCLMGLWVYTQKKCCSGATKCALMG